MCLKYEKQFPKPETTYKKSPNYSARNGVPIGQIVYHYTTSNNVDGVISWLCNPKAQVSAHYVIDRSGNLYQLVKDADRAWHGAGRDAGRGHGQDPSGSPDCHVFPCGGHGVTA